MNRPLGYNATGIAFDRKIDKIIIAGGDFWSRSRVSVHSAARGWRSFFFPGDGAQDDVPGFSMRDLHLYKLGHRQGF